MLYSPAPRDASAVCSVKGPGALSRGYTQLPKSCTKVQNDLSDHAEKQNHVKCKYVHKHLENEEKYIAVIHLRKLGVHT